MKRTSTFALLLALFAAPAQATPVVATFDIKATNFISIPSGVVPPVPDVALNFTVTLDSDDAHAPFGPTDDGIKLNAANLPLGFLEFAYAPFGNVLFVGTTGALRQSGDFFDYNLVPDTNGLVLRIDSPFTQQPKLIQLAYTHAGTTITGAVFTAGSLLGGGQQVQIPEPVTLSVFGLGVAALIGLARRRRARA